MLDKKEVWKYYSFYIVFLIFKTYLWILEANVNNFIYR